MDETTQNTGQTDAFVRMLAQLGAPTTDAKEDFSSDDAIVMKMPEAFAPDILREFLTQIQAARKQEVV